VTDLPAPPPSRSVAVILKGYPRLSETFIAQELLGLERRGLRLHLISLRQPTERATHPVHREIEAPVLYLPEYVWHAPLRVLRAWRRARLLPGYRASRQQWLRDWWRDRTPNRGRRFAQACVLAHELPTGVAHLHAHFLHTPASVARYAALMTGLPWSCSAHAKDIWTIPDWEKREKLAHMRWLVTCTKAGAEHLRRLAPDPEHVELVYHGLDFARFPAAPAARRPRDGSDPDDPVTLLSVGRLVAKKGYDVLIDALALLPAGLNWRLVHIGGGKLKRRMRRRAAQAGVAGRMDWLGARPQEEVLRHYRAADLFVLASRVARDGDRDGLPNVLMEAASQGLAAVATRAGAIAEIVLDDTTGLLVPPNDPAALAEALAELIAAPARRAALGRAAELRVRHEFGHDGGIDRVAQRLGAARGAADRLCASPSTRP
jgi:glycosyltransferase involved in cell wall biosynthesis